MFDKRDEFYKRKINEEPIELDGVTTFPGSSVHN